MRAACRPLVGTRFELLAPMRSEAEASHIARIVERLRRDHPDPSMRMQLYDDGGLPAYVRSLMTDGSADDDAMLARITAAVRAAETGEPGEMR
jgi:hypothetical protein